MQCTANDLREKIVINICDGRKLGYIYDFGLDLCDGRVTSIIVTGNSGILCFKHDDTVTIKWDKIVRIGDDAILVDAGESECICGSDNCECRKKRKFPFFW